MSRVCKSLILVLLISFSAVAQNKKVFRKKKADEYFAMEVYQYALPTYLKELKEDPENGELNLKAGVCLLNSPSKREAIPYLERASIDGVAPAYFYLGQAFHYNNQLEKALENYLLFKRYCSVQDYERHNVDRHINITLRAQEMIANPVDVDIENLGAAVNSSAADYVPVVSADESVLIFTSRREGSIGGLQDQYGAYYEDLYISTRENSKWSEARNMGDNVNSELHDASVSLSADGQKLIIYRMNKETYGGDLYLSKLEGTTWGIPDKIEGDINSDYWEPSACFSADQKLLFFSSNRPGGFGGRDIYLSKKLPDGTWGIPQNLGPIVNTPYDDDAPFLHPDGKTLYFSSRGHKTMGGFDIFKSIMQPNQMWTLPENLGYPVNTVDDDIYFVLSTDGQRGYYSSDKEGGYGDKDIYVIHMGEEKVPLTVVKGKVFKKGSSLPLDATITVFNTEDKEVQGIYRPNTATGKFILILPPDKNFKVVVEADGYHSWSEILSISSEDEFQELDKDIYLLPMD